MKDYPNSNTVFGACLQDVYIRYYARSGRDNLKITSLSSAEYQSLCARGLSIDGDILLVHGIVRERRRNMSVQKTIASGLIQSYGADVFTLSHVMGSGLKRDIYLSKEKCAAAERFCVKLCHAARFLAMNYEPSHGEGVKEEEDEWIIQELDTLKEEYIKNMDSFMPGLALHKVYVFVRKRLCGWYIEQIKPRIYGSDINSKGASQRTLHYVLTQLLDMLHPFAPNVCRDISNVLDVK